MWKWLLGLTMVCTGLGAEEAKLRVQGTAVMLQAADKVTMRVGVVTRDADAQKAAASNKEKMSKVVTAIQMAGLSDKEYQTGKYTITPKFAVPPKNPPADWQATIVGYEVKNTLKVQTNRLDMVGSLIDAIVKEGSNLIEEVTFSLQDAEQAESQAIRLAVKQARAYAEAAAEAANNRLGDVLEIEIHPSYTPVRALRMEKLAMNASDTSTPLSPGDIQVDANVSVTFQLKGRQ